MTARALDVNGWMEVKRNPISRVGVFDYSGAQLGFKTEPMRSKIFKVLRPADELGSPETIESFKLTPWVNDHAMIGPAAMAAMPGMAMKAEQKGVHGVIGQNVEFDGTTLYGNIKAFSDGFQSLIESGKTDLSAGYRCKYDMTPGVHPEFGAYDAVQRNIRGNHLALVDEGRMGPTVAVMDSLVFSFDAKEATMADEVKDAPAGDTPKDMTVAEIAAMLKTLAPQVAALQSAMAAMTAPPAGDTPAPVVDKAPEAAAAAAPAPAATIDALPAATGMDAKVLTGLVATMDSMNKTLTKLGADVATARASAPSVVLAEFAARDSLAKALSAHVGTFDYAAMDSAAVTAYGVEKLGLKPAKGHELSALQAYMQGAGAAGNTVRIGTGMDSKAPGARPAFLTAHLTAAE